MVFENHIESLIQYCERSELRLQKLIKNAKNGHFWRVFENAIFLVIFKHCADRLGTTSLFPLLSSKKIILVTSACFRSMATTAGDQKWLWKMVVLRTTLVHNVRG